MLTYLTLSNGKILIVGGLKGETSTDYLSPAEMYDPGLGQFTTTGSMGIGRSRHTATLLMDGKVLVIGGYGTNMSSLASAEIYDPATGTFTPTATMTNPRAEHTATLLTDGRVLVAGGTAYNVPGAADAVPSAEIFDPLRAASSV